MVHVCLVPANRAGLVLIVLIATNTTRVSTVRHHARVNSEFVTQARKVMECAKTGHAFKIMKVQIVTIAQLVIVKPVFVNMENVKRMMRKTVRLGIARLVLVKLIGLEPIAMIAPLLYSDSSVIKRVPANMEHVILV